MSDTVIDTPAPAATPAPAEPATPAALPEQPTAPSRPNRHASPRQAAKDAAKQGMHDAARSIFEKAAIAEPGAVVDGGDASAPEPKVDAFGRKHSPTDGKYLPEQQSGEGTQDDSGASTEAAPTEDPLAQGGEAGAQDEDAAASSEAAGERVRVELGDHPIAGSGVAAIHVADEREAEAVRGLLNGTHVRVKENQELRQSLAEVRAALDQEVRSRIDREAGESAQQEWKQTPAYKERVARYKGILETHGKEAASEYWTGIQGELAQLKEAKRDALLSEYEVQQATKVAEQWRNAAVARTSALPEQIRALPELQGWLKEEFAAFDAVVDEGRFDAELQKIPEDSRFEWLLNKFGHRFALRLRNEPRVLELYRNRNPAGPKSTNGKPEDIEARIQKERDEAAKKAVDAYKRQAAQKRQDMPPHPLGGAGGEEPAMVSRPEEQPDVENMTSHELKRYHREKAREDARRRRIG